LCEQRPKPLLQVGEHALVEHILLRLAASSIRDVFVNLHFGAEQLVERLGNGSRYGVRLEYFREPTLLGTAGTPRALASRAADGLLVHYGDVLSEHALSGLLDRFYASEAAARIVVHERAGSNSRVQLGSGGRVERFLERPDAAAAATVTSNWAFSGICVLSGACLRSLPAVATDLPRDVFPALAAQGELFAEPHTGYRCAIDSPARLTRARADYDAGRLSPTVSREAT
jgi:NDP-sugar pyrophosphorylase family protein